MKLTADWNDLLIEKGILDPLGLWRVGDRMVSTLLGPFTTVVSNRPARYLSMYCWIFFATTSQEIGEDERKFWKRFFQLEAVLLCSIAAHKEHNYDKFSGMIGSEGARLLIEKNVDRALDLKNLSKIPNGWETNYKGMMQQFSLLAPDHSRPGGMVLTAEGTELAKAYEKSISGTEFFRSYKKLETIPFRVIESLSAHSCTCLLNTPASEPLRDERETCIKHLLKRKTGLAQSDDGQDLLWDSMRLLLNAVMAFAQEGQPFSVFRWRQALSTQRVAAGKAYVPPPNLQNVFARWQVYNLDSLFVYSLESGLSGFLQMLHERNGWIPADAILAEEFEPILTTALRSTILGYLIDSVTSVSETLVALDGVEAEELSALESHLVRMTSESVSGDKMAYAYLVFVYCLHGFSRFSGDEANEDAVDFYRRRACRDGAEYSLIHTLDDLGNRSCSLLSCFVELFMREAVVNRQLRTRQTREKEQAWFSFVHETKTYEWESDYDTKPYRAPRSSIFMSFLESLELVRWTDDLGGGWLPNLPLLDEVGN